ncbi:hypothetical protein CQ046_08510 [Chryseobacterium sp. MYb7]|uniref:hypothetical protein n=1 Tax=Chryseobacterium sp. MYb7 TaxID=1827290 RepID=UPI000CFFB29C|nr:hypothetical protein [Chryseobacterium sp. MYb7]PRB03824.1 hypothetical protein CQ046_08510 [Chryseobacterium sp. MYb7]
MLENKTYRYSSEFGINMFLKKYQILQQQELKVFSKMNVFTENDPCHIYFILKRPRIIIDPDYFISNDEFYELKFKIQVKDKYITQIHKFPHANNKVLEIFSEYPNNYFTAIFENGDVTYIKVGALIDNIQQDYDYDIPLLDYEVLYIGQAYGEDGKRTAIDRLDSHTTLQKIYNEAIIRFPDSEIWLMLANFGQKNITSMIGGIDIYTESKDNEVNRFMNFLDLDKMEISGDQKINFTEAALINLFKPPFNEDYKENFPSKTHVSYKDCYKLDVHSLSINLDMSDYNRWIYTDAFPRGINNEILKYCHSCNFNFITDDDRFRLFNNDYLNL